MNAVTTNEAPRALIADDCVAVRSQVALALGKAGFETDVAENGEEALELAARHQYKIVFLDVVMPGPSGYEVCAELKKSPATKHMPVVILTANSSLRDRFRGRMSGCDAFLRKPVTLRDFNRALQLCNLLPAAA